MLNGCPGPVTIGRLDAASPYVGQFLLAGRNATASGIVPLDTSLTAVGNTSSVEVKTAADGSSNTVLTFSRPLIVPNPHHPSELSVDETKEEGYVYAIGPQGTAEFRKHDEKGYFTLKLYPAACDRASTCSGRGSCVLVNASYSYCSCDLGYNKTDCSACSVGFGRGNDATTCAPMTSPEMNSTIAVKVTMRLNLSFSAVTANKQAFETSLKKDLSAALAVPSSRINITALRAGSVIADFVLLPPDATTAAAKLAAAAADSSSALYRGTVTRNLDVWTTPLAFDTVAVVPPSASSTSVPPAPSIGDSGGAAGEGNNNKYDKSISLRSDLELSWRLYKSSVSRWSVDKIAIRLRYTGDSWFSFGLATDSRLSMIGADVILVQPGFPLGSQVMQAVLRGYALYEVVSVDDETGEKSEGPLDDIMVTTTTTSAASNGQNTTTMVVEFTRYLAAGAYDGALSFAAHGLVPVIWAVGFSGEKILGMHPSSGLGSGFMDFTRGKLDTTHTVRNLMISHGAFMVASWGFFIPVGVFFARFGKRIYPYYGPAPRWLVIHKWFQYLGLLFSIVGFCLAIGFIQREASVHFDSLHSVLGLAVVLIGVILPLTAFFRPRSRDEAQQPKVTTTKERDDEEESFFHRATVIVWSLLHRSLGYLSVIAGSVAIFLGMYDFGVEASSASMVLYSMLVVLLGAFFIWREGRVRGCWFSLPPLSPLTTMEPVLTTAIGASSSKPIEPIVIKVGHRSSRVASALGAATYSSSTLKDAVRSVKEGAERSDDRRKRREEQDLHDEDNEERDDPRTASDRKTAGSSRSTSGVGKNRHDDEDNTSNSYHHGRHRLPPQGTANPAVSSNGTGTTTSLSRRGNRRANHR
jgi:Eukaryotic cytochrome b561